MPIYEYECINNKHRFEVIQKFSDPPVAHCIVCGEPVEKLLSSPAIQFKGTGWYITDYARKGSSTSETSDKKSSDKPSTETTASTETKSEKPASTAAASDKKES
ncbi:MAG TPA: FmdB family zinc ribbon protein [Acidobacteriota bacterium]|nr:FmdB family zinc ribbon protein [Acidobacteriota bacterium]